MRNHGKRLLALLLALLLLTLCACGKRPAQDENPPSQQTPETPPQADTPGEPTVPETPDTPEEPVIPTAVTVEARTCGDTVTEEGVTLMEYILSYPSLPELDQADAYYAALQQQRLEALEQDQAELSQQRAEAENGTTGTLFLIHTYETDYQVLRNDGLLLSILRTSQDYTGGVHSQSSYAAETILVAEQRLLTLDELFSVSAEDYLPRILEGILQEMDEAEQQAGTEIYYDDSRDSLAELFDPTQFAVDGDALVFFFPEYVLAPYAAGMQLFRLDTAEYQDILNDAWFFS